MYGGLSSSPQIVLGELGSGIEDSYRESWSSCSELNGRRDNSKFLEGFFRTSCLVANLKN